MNTLTPSYMNTPMPSHKKTILFDFDGTLADTLPQLFLISNRLSGVYGYKKVKEEEIESYRRKKTREALRSLEIPLLQMPRIAVHIEQELRQNMHLVRPFTHIRETLDSLKDRFCLGIVTSNSAQNVDFFLKENQMEWFDIILTGSSVFGKSRLLRKLMREHHLTASETTYVGDETRDIEAAQRTGIDMVAVSWGLNAAETLARMQPTFLVHHPQELVSLFA